MKKLACLLLVFIFLFASCGKNKEEKTTPVTGKKVAYIINMPKSEIFELCAQQCVEISQKLGMTCDVFFTDGNHQKFKNQVEKCGNEKYDGLFLSHGGRDYSYKLVKDVLNAHKNMKVVTFDTEFLDIEGNTKKIDGVTQFFQDDAQLSTTLLNYVTTNIAKDKKPANILKVWVGPGYLSAFDRREIGYKQFEDQGKIKTVEVIGPTDKTKPTQSMHKVMTETLKKYKESDIDAIWVAYDAYAQGCFTALKESGKNIPLVSIDICNKDIDYMLEKNSNWKACACTDFKANGEQGIRILALQLAGDYNSIKAPGSSTKTDFLEMPASLITSSILKSDSNIANIYNVAPETYGNKANFVTNSWLKKAIGY